MLFAFSMFSRLDWSCRRTIKGWSLEWSDQLGREGTTTGEGGDPGKAREVLVACSIFDPAVFKMKDGVLMFTKAANRNQTGEVGRICIPASMVREVWSLCHQSDLGGHRGLEGTLNKFLRGFFMLSARLKLRFLNGGCDTCIVKERSMPVRTGVHMPSLTGYVGVNCT